MATEDRSIKEIWDEMDEVTKKSVQLLVGENTTAVEKMVIVCILRTPELLDVVDNGQ